MSALARAASLTLCNGSPPSQKTMSPIRAIFERRDPIASEYSHERIANKSHKLTNGSVKLTRLRLCHQLDHGRGKGLSLVWLRVF